MGETARIAVVAATVPTRGGAVLPESEVLAFAGWRLDPGAKTLSDQAGREVYLRRSEFRLLATLAARSGRVQSREQLLDAVAGRRATPFDRNIDMLVARLRNKIEADRRSPKIIVTVVGFGYKLVAEPERPASQAPLVSARHPPIRPHERASVAVLPFIAHQPSEAENVAAASLTEELLAVLARGSGQVVIAGSRAARQAVQAIGLRQVGRELGARYIVSGSLRRQRFIAAHQRASGGCCQRRASLDRARYG